MGDLITRSLQAPRTLRKKEFFLVEGLRRCVLEGDVAKGLEAGPHPEAERALPPEGQRKDGRMGR